MTDSFPLDHSTVAGPRKKVYRKFKTSLNIGFLNVDTLSGQKLHDLNSLFKKENFSNFRPQVRYPWTS